MVSGSDAIIPQADGTHGTGVGVSAHLHIQAMLKWIHKWSVGSVMSV